MFPTQESIVEVRRSLEQDGRRMPPDEVVALFLDILEELESMKYGDIKSLEK